MAATTIWHSCVVRSTLEWLNCPQSTSLVLHVLHMHATLFLIHVSTSKIDFICRKQLFVTYTN
jgi:hypothetical protein